MPQTKITKNKLINGILLLDKPLHLSSNGALQRVKRLFGAKKAGHTGSLDPLATGMLPLCFGEATKLSQYLLESDKYYHVTVKFGEKTATGDAEGEVIARCSAEHITREKIKSILPSFIGKLQQIPPMFSALKHQGKPLYELARQGIEVERKSREITIYSLEMEEDEERFSFAVHCSKGTYIRTLVEDIAAALDCYAYVTGLRRTAVSPYQEAQMITLSELEDMAKQHGQDALLHTLLPLETAIEHFPIVNLSASTAFYVRTGNSVMVPQLPSAGLVRLFSEDNKLMGIGEVLGDGRVAPKRLMSFQSSTL